MPPTTPFSFNLYFSIFVSEVKDYPLAQLLKDVYEKYLSFLNKEPPVSNK
ncbi:MAG: hypothetical protein ACP5LN_10935 [Thermoproteota archaeon]